MAVVSVNEAGEGLEAEIGVDGNTYTRVFKIKVDDILTASFDAITAPGLPLIGEPHPDDPSVRAKRRRLRQTESRLHFTVFVEYEDIDSSEAEDPDPLKREPEINWTGTEIQIPIVKDALTGEPIENSAGDQFDPLPEESFSIPTVVITRNEPIFDPLVAINFRNKNNSGPFSVAGLLVPAAAQAKLKQFDATQEVENDFPFQRVTYRLQFLIGEVDSAEAQLGHDRLLLDQGLNVADVNGDKTRIRLADGTETDKLQKLGGTGVLLPVGAPAVYLRFATAKRLDFTSLNLPTTLLF